jgi:hypothetical protein
MQAAVIDAKVVAKERKQGFVISRISRFRYPGRPATPWVVPAQLALIARLP